MRALDVTVAEAQALRTRALEVRRRCQGLMVGEELAPPSSEVSIGMLRTAVERADMAVQRAVERSVLTREYDLAELQREETADARATMQGSQVSAPRGLATHRRAGHAVRGGGAVAGRSKGATSEGCSMERFLALSASRARALGHAASTGPSAAGSTGARARGEG